MAVAVASQATLTLSHLVLYSIRNIHKSCDTLLHHFIREYSCIKLELELVIEPGIPSSVVFSKSCD